MATKKKSPMTSFSSFEELASSGKVQNFNYERVKRNTELQKFKDSYDAKKHYEELKQKARVIDEVRNDYYRWKSYWDFLDGTMSISAIQKKVEKTFNELYAKGNDLSPKEEQLHNAACFFNNGHWKTHKEVSDEVKVVLVAYEQQLKEAKEEKNISEYSNAIRIAKKLNKAGIDDEVQSYKSYGAICETEQEYHYAMMAAKLEWYFSWVYAEKKSISPNYENYINWLNNMVRKYEPEKTK